MVRSVFAADLVDELLLTIESIVLGGEKTIFAENGKAIPFTLESTTKASAGAQDCRYVRARISKTSAYSLVRPYLPICLAITAE